jgi:HD-GYP domain-containing protein (c-di-GMP phosphodiesterase class II)
VKTGTLPLEERPLYNSRIIDNFIKLIRRRYSYVNVSELLSYANMETYQVEDENHWFTQKQVDRFMERVEKLTGNNNLAREAGLYAASPDAIGVMRLYILGLAGPAKAYEMVGKYASNFTRSASYVSSKIGHNRVEIKVTPYPGVREQPFQCENRMGHWESIASMFNYRLPRIEHPECLFRGGKSCTYVVSWRDSHSAFWKKIQMYVMLTFFFVLPAFYFLVPETTLHLLVPLSALMLAGLSVFTQHLEKKELNAATNNLRDSTERLMTQLNTNYENTLMINEIGQALSKKRDVNGILSEVIRVFQRRLDYDRGMVLLADKDKRSLAFRTGFGYSREQLSILRNVRFHLDKPGSKGVFVVSFREQKPFLINDIHEIKENLSARSLEFAVWIGTKSFICCPIVYEDECLGILAVDNVKTKRPLLQSDINLIRSISLTLGISLHNAALFEAKESQFHSMLRVLAASIDARDHLTAGHSERVTDYVLGICREMNMPHGFCEMMRVASLLHDYGKIAVRDSILKKEGRLTAEEFSEIRKHAERSRSILEQINFEGIYEDVPVIAGSHHEKLDGTGYPRGLKGEEIHIGARILKVADFFEAVTSKRHYRDPMPLDVAFQMLRDGCGTEFDSDVVETFILYYEKTIGPVPEPDAARVRRQ